MCMGQSRIGEEVLVFGFILLLVVMFRFFFPRLKTSFFWVLGLYLTSLTFN